MQNVVMKPIIETYQNEAKRLILEGMKERFGFIDYSLNPDLHDIYSHYSKDGNIFFIGFLDDELVCTGALTNESHTTGRLVRMSVKMVHRRKGIAQKMLDHLEGQALRRSYSRIVLETNQDWNSAIRFYKKNGYNFDFQENERVHFMKELN